MKTAIILKQKVSTLTSVLCGTLLGLTAVSCADKNFDWEDAKSQNPEYVFRSNFESLVGPIDPNQSWDFSTAGRNAATRAITSGNVTSGTNEMTFSADFRGKIADVLPEGRDNSDNGNPYVLYAEGGFDIYPIYHGKCMQWDLYVNDVKVGSYADIMSKMDESTVYGEGKTTELKTSGWHIDAPYGEPIFIKLVVTKSNTGNASEGSYANNGDVITSVYTTPVAYNERWVGGFLNPRYEYDYLYNGSLVLDFDGDAAKNKELTKPEGVEMVIMFEDAKTKRCDADFNDFVLAISGKISPKEVDPDGNKIPLEHKVSKRYMVEDLGSTAKTDIDFNDLVIDLIEIQPGKCEQDENGDPKPDTWVADGDKTQTAQIRAMGGTLDFLFMLTREDGGVTKYKPIYKKSANVSDVKEMKYTYPDDIARGYENLIVGAPFTITGWNPATNNVAFYVSREEIDINVDGTEITTIDQDNTSASGNLYSSFATAPYKFPNPGDVPYIIAFDPTKNWRQERQKICSHWITGTLNGNAECSTCGSNETDYTK